MTNSLAHCKCHHSLSTFCQSLRPLEFTWITCCWNFDQWNFREFPPFHIFHSISSRYPAIKFFKQKINIFYLIYDVVERFIDDVDEWVGQLSLLKLYWDVNDGRCRFNDSTKHIFTIFDWNRVENESNARPINGSEGEAESFNETSKHKKIFYRERRPKRKMDATASSNKSDDQIESEMNNGWNTSEKSWKKLRRSLSSLKRQLNWELKRLEFRWSKSEKECRELDKNEMKTLRENFMWFYGLNNISSEGEWWKWLRERRYRSIQLARENPKNYANSQQK